MTASNTASSENIIPLPRAAVLPVAKFKHRGREWTIRTRRPGEGATWYLYFEHKRRRCLWSLGTDSKAVAIAEAKLKLDLFFAQRERELRASMSHSDTGGFTTLAEIIGRKGTDDAGVLYVVPTKKMASAQTRHKYGEALRWVLRLALDVEDAEVERLTTAIFTRETARKFFDAVNARAASCAGQAERRRWLALAYGQWNHALALLAPRPLTAMQETHGMTFPAMHEWRDGRKIYGQRVPKVSGVELPDAHTIARTLAEWRRIATTPGYVIPGPRRSDYRPGALTETDRRNLFIAVGIQLACGLRAGETAQVRRDWIQRDAGGLPLLVCRDEGTAEFKNQTGRLEVAPLDPFWRVLWFHIRRNGWDVGPRDHILISRPVERASRGAMQPDGNKCDREYWPMVHVSHWLRGLGWKTQKTNHALRDYSASMITMRYGLGPACRWCRHDSVKTTERSYNRFVTMERERDEKRLRWLRWAK